MSSRLVSREADERMPVATFRADVQAGREALRARLDDEERANAFGVGVLCKLAFPGDES